MCVGKNTHIFFLCVFFPTHIFFLHTSSSCNCPRKPFAVTRRSRRALHTEGAPHARAGFVQSLSAALGSGLLQAPHFAFWLLFHRSHTKSTAISCTACCFVCNSVQFCSCTTSSNELPHLLPSSRARCALVHGIRCWLETSSHVLFCFAKPGQAVSLYLVGH